MSITYDLVHPDGYILETWSGLISIEEVRHHWGMMLRDEECLALRRSLGDLRSATLSFSDQDISFLFQEIAMPLLGKRTWNSAIVVQHSAQLRLASRYINFVSGKSRDAVFSNIESARRWLLQQADLSDA